MLFMIGNPVPAETIEPGFYLVMDFMHGDADKYETLRVLHVDDTDQGRQELEEAIELTIRAQKLMAPGGGCDAEAGSEILYDTVVGDEWPGDVTADHQFKARCQAYYVRYFDDCGVEYEVDLED
jgi:hypothetical protein